MTEIARKVQVIGAEIRTHIRLVDLPVTAIGGLPDTAKFIERIDNSASAAHNGKSCIARIPWTSDIFPGHASIGRTNHAYIGKPIVIIILLVYCCPYSGNMSSRFATNKTDNLPCDSKICGGIDRVSS